MAASAMAHLGVEGPTLRQRVADLYPSNPGAKKINKVPFSTEGKECLEQSLRAALALGHSYIGTEHLFFGVQRQGESNARRLDELLGVSAAEIQRRLTEMLARSTSSPSTRSPALHAALDRARSRAGQSPMTTGHVLGAMLADPDNQVCHALAEIGADPQEMLAALDTVNLANTSDASPSPQSVAITIGGTTTVIADPDVAGALQQFSTEQLRIVLRDAIERPDPGQSSQA